MIGYRYNAKCVRVVDGDTIDCEVDLGFHACVKIRFRLARINTPELNSKDEGERFRAKRAADVVSALILNKDIEIVSHKTEKYGRFLAEVYFGSGDELLNLSDELLNGGLAEVYA